MWAEDEDEEPDGFGEMRSVASSCCGERYPLRTSNSPSFGIGVTCSAFRREMRSRHSRTCSAVASPCSTTSCAKSDSDGVPESPMRPFYGADRPGASELQRTN